MDNPLIKKLLDLNLPTKDYALFGSAIMHFHGLKDLGHDIDIVARGEAWKKACEIKEPEIPSSNKGLVVKPYDDEIEIFSEWFPGEWDINNLIDNAEVVGGIKVVGFKDVIKWKELMGREKDFEHIEVIKNYLLEKNIYLSPEIKIIKGKDIPRKHIDAINEARKKEFDSSSLVDPQPHNDDWEKLYFLLEDKITDKLLAFARIHNVEVKISDNTYNILGLATLVAVTKGLGYGSKVLSGLINYAQETRKTAIGFCNPKLSRFYKRRGLKIIKRGGKRFIFRDENGNVVPSRFGINDVVYIQGDDNMIDILLKEKENIAYISRPQW